jgi:hypothetical protein
MKPGRSCCSWLSFTLLYTEYMSMPVVSVSSRTIPMSAAFCRSLCLQLLTGHGLRRHATEIAHFSIVIAKVVSQHVEQLQPVAELLGE